jgi:hydroxyethylthiazole kinase-like sugar kinase family protein
MTFRIRTWLARLVKVAAVCCSAAACTGAFASVAQGAANAPNPAASCTGLGANFASQFGSANGQLQSEIAKALRPLGQQISATSQQHLGSYDACIGG